MEKMAIGLGLMFNLRLPVNFNSPYQATSIITRWPMSPTSTGGGDLVPLTGWSVYLPLGRKPDEGE